MYCISIAIFTRVEELNRLLHICFERINSWKESFWIVYQISCRQDCTKTLIDKHYIKCLFSYIHENEDIIDIKCLVAILRTFGNIIAVDNSGYSANEFIFGLQNEKYILRNILIRNKQVNLNDECAWLLGNVLNVLQITEFNDGCSLTPENFDEMCKYLFV